MTDLTSHRTIHVALNYLVDDIDFSGLVESWRYNASGDSWSQFDQFEDGKVLTGLERNEYFGSSLAISSDGSVLAVGSLDVANGRKGMFLFEHYS